MNRPHRSLAVVASLPQLCAVCRNHREVQLVRLNGIDPAPRGTTVNCPHCSNHATAVPIYVYPMRVDQPRGAS